MNIVPSKVIIESLKDDPQTIETIVDTVANGGSLVTLCRVWGVSYPKMKRWIAEDKDRIKKYEEAKEDRKEWFLEMVIQELQNLALSDIRQAFNQDGSMKHPTEWPESLAKAVAGLEIAELFDGYGKERELIGETKKLKLWDKKGSLELIGKALAMFIDKKEVSGSITLEALVSGSRRMEEGKE